MYYPQKQDDAELVESITAGILDLDLYADDNDDVVAEHTADLTATSHLDGDGDEDEEHALSAAESSHQPPPHQPASTADDA